MDNETYESSYVRLVYLRVFFLIYTYKHLCIILNNWLETGKKNVQGWNDQGEEIRILGIKGRKCVRRLICSMGKMKARLLGREQLWDGQGLPGSLHCSSNSLQGQGKQIMGLMRLVFVGLLNVVRREQRSGYRIWRRTTFKLLTIVLSVSFKSAGNWEVDWGRKELWGVEWLQSILSIENICV